MKLHGLIGYQMLLNNTLKTKARQFCPSFRNDVKWNGDRSKKGFGKRENTERKMSEKEDVITQIKGQSEENHS